MRRNHAAILTAAALVAVALAGLLVAARLVPPLVAGTAAAAWTLALVLLGGVLASWLDRRRQDRVVRLAVAREVGRWRWLTRDADRERPASVDQDTVELPATARQLAEVRGRLEYVEGRLANVEGRLDEARRQEERAAEFVDGVRGRYVAALNRRLPPWPAN